MASAHKSFVLMRNGGNGRTLMIAALQARLGRWRSPRDVISFVFVMWESKLADRLSRRTAQEEQNRQIVIAKSSALANESNRK